MNTSTGSIGSALTVLESHAIRKVSRDAGFDILFDRLGSVVGESSHAPLICAIWNSTNSGFIVALSMANVVHALESDIGQAINSARLPSASSEMAGAFHASDIFRLEALLKRAWQLSRSLPNALISRFEKALSEVSATEREVTVRQRIGQNLFREGLLALWGGRCAITGLDAPELLRASHAKPWADSSDIERLDVFNGLLLAAHWDAAFDSGLITISTSGHVVPSAALSDSTIEVLGLSEDLCIRLQPQHDPYLAWHRERVFKQS
ncbi:HNH endonuclease [Limnohabitans sp.]